MADIHNLLNTICACVVGLLAWALNKIMSKNEEEISNLNERVSAAEKDINELSTAVAVIEAGSHK